MGSSWNMERTPLGKRTNDRRTDVPQYSVNTIEDMQKLLLGYRDNMRVEIEPGVAVTAKTVADLRARPTWPEGLALNIRISLDPGLSVVKVERASGSNGGLIAPSRHLGLSRSRENGGGLVERFLRTLVVVFEIVWGLTIPVTYVLAVVDTWRQPMSVLAKLAINVTLDLLAAGFWPITWIIWIVEYHMGRPSPLSLLFGG